MSFTVHWGDVIAISGCINKTDLIWFEGNHAGERGYEELCFKSNETFFFSEASTRSDVPETAAEYLIVAEFSWESSAAALARVTHVSLNGSSEIPPHSSEQK